MLLYGCEVWAHEGRDILENVYIRFCKYVLGVNKSTCRPTNMVYGEPGATPLSLISQGRMVIFWEKKQVDENPKISSLLFQILLKMYKKRQFLQLRTYWKVGFAQALGNTNVFHLVQTILKSYYSNVSGNNVFKNGHKYRYQMHQLQDV